MTTIEITLPDQLAEQVANSGLLATDKLAEMFRAQLRKNAGSRLQEMMDQMHAVDDGQPPMSPEDVAEEIRIMRAERRKAAGR